MGTVIFLGCNEQGNELSLQYTIVYEDHQTIHYGFPPGNYYYYEFPEPEHADHDVDAIFIQIIERGNQLREAWYKSYTSSCVPPGSDQGMSVIVPGSLIIRVNQPVIGLKAIGFVETTDPDVGSCAYGVQHYQF